MLCYAQGSPVKETGMEIRRAQAADLEAAAALWHERMALLREAGSGFELADDAVDRWRRRAASWVADAEFAFYIAEADGEIVGLVVVTTQAGKAGRWPERSGLLLELAVDLHQALSGLSGRLLAAATAWLRSRDIAVLEIQAPANYPVEDAFWRAQGAALSARQYRLRL